MHGDKQNDASSAPAAKATARDFALRLALFYGALFLIYGVHLPYLPVWFDWRGLRPDEIALIAAAPYFLRVLITPAAAMLADQLALHRQMVIWLSLAASAFALFLSQSGSFWPILLWSVPFAIAVSIIMPLTETIAVQGVRAAGLDYGRMRLWGSITFVVVNFSAGLLIDRFGPVAAIALLIFGALATAAAAPFLPNGFAALQVAALAPPRRRRISLDDARRLAVSPLFLLFLTSAGAVQGAHAMFYTFGVLHWREQGIAATWIGALWAIGIACEVLLFAYSSRIVRRIGPAELQVLAAAAAVLRWSITGFDPPLWLLVPLQMLHGLTYGASHLGAMHFISRAVPESASATAQAAYATIAAGLMSGIATIIAGHLYGAIGGEAYFAMAAIAALGLAAALVVLKRWDGGALWRET